MCIIIILHAYLCVLKLVGFPCSHFPYHFVYISQPYVADRRQAFGNHFWRIFHSRESTALATWLRPGLNRFMEQLNYRVVFFTGNLPYDRFLTIAQNGWMGSKRPKADNGAGWGERGGGEDSRPAIKPSPGHPLITSLFFRNILRFILCL